MDDKTAERTSGFDLDGYCRRIGYTGLRAPTLDTLRAVHLKHPQAIPFENIDVLLRRPVHIDADGLQRKLVGGGRGGYCFEQNLLLAHALTALGFDIAILTGRVRYMVPPERHMPLTHMLLRVEAEGASYIADVGFGANTLTAPLALAEPGEQATPHEPARLIEADGRRRVEVKLPTGWVQLYNFSLEPQHMPDLEVGNWFMSTYPGSRFYDELAVSRAVPEGRYALSGNRLTIHRLDGTSERRVLQTESELRDVLTGYFGLTLPDDPGLGPTLARTIVGAV